MQTDLKKYFSCKIDRFPYSYRVTLLFLKPFIVSISALFIISNIKHNIFVIAIFIITNSKIYYKINCDKMTSHPKNFQ